MSSSNSHSSIFSNSSVSSPCEIEVERVETEYFEASHGGHVDGNSDEHEASLDEPIADEAWLEEYPFIVFLSLSMMRYLEVRFKGNKPVTSWEYLTPKLGQY